MIVILKPLKLCSDKCHKTSQMISQHWWWFGIDRQQAITSANVDQILQYNMASLGPNENWTEKANIIGCCYLISNIIQYFIWDNNRKYKRGPTFNSQNTLYIPTLYMRHEISLMNNLLKMAVIYRDITVSLQVGSRMKNQWGGGGVTGERIHIHVIWVNNWPFFTGAPLEYEVKGHKSCREMFSTVFINPFDPEQHSHISK